jgi:flagellar biosynthesis anti-sigma factor FlgM
MRISAVSEAFSPELRRIQGAKRISKDTKGLAAPKDSSTISQKAKGLRETRGYSQVVAAHVANQPDIRVEKVAEVKEKINSGYYNSDEFVDKLADKLMQEFGLAKAPGK